MAFQVGTGGQLTENYYKNRGSKGYTYASYQAFEDIGGALLLPPPTAADYLLHLRDHAKISVTHLASLLGVSRQILYDWQKGSQPTALNLSKLERLSELVDHMDAAGLTLSQQNFSRKLPGGLTILELVRDGAAPEVAIQIFSALRAKEAAQRALVKDRLAQRQSRAAHLYDDAGSPYLDEPS
ncbi:MAG: hypothetical protein EPN74_16510 [Rhodanobacter sp.]|nr:MAG: hypothetical protein EPN74_16510 [Rhodanobacter sp.]